jgi:hypothetical protein
MRKRLMKTNLLMSILALLLFACASDAFGQFNPDFLYNITARHSGKCLDVYGWGRDDGTQVHQFNCVEGAQNQQWSIVPVGDGSDYYRVMVKHSGKALDVNGGIFTFWDGVPVKQWQYWGSANQMWRFVPLGNDVYQIVARHSGKSLEINVGPGPRENYGIAQQSSYWNRPNQQFKVTALPSANCRADQLGATLVGGTSDLVASRVSNESFIQPANLTIDITQCRGIVRLTRFEPTTTRMYMTPLGLNTTTVSLIGGGSGSISSARNLSVQVTLHFEHSLGRSPERWRAAAAAPSDLTLTLTGLVAPNGDVTLTGSGTFVGGYLNGSNGNLKVTGRIAPSP